MQRVQEPERHAGGRAVAGAHDLFFGTVLTTLNKPMFAGSGAVYAAFGTVATLYWVTAGAGTPCTACRLFGDSA